MESSSYLDRALRSAVTAVRRAARLVRKRRYDLPPLMPKEDGSQVTEVDLESERLMRRLLRERHPNHSIVGEESPLESGSEPWIWYLDPLDGTRAFARGQDTCAVAATLTHEGLPILAAIAAPFTGEIYTAFPGRGTEVNGRTAHVAASRPLPEAEILVYYDAGEPGLTALNAAASRGNLGRMTVLPGSFILNACRTAKGAYDAYLCVKRRASPLMAWDLAPASLALGGAGGTMQDLGGAPMAGMVPSREVVAGSPEAVREIIRVLGERIRDPLPLLPWARRSEAVFARLSGLALARAARCQSGACLLGIGGAGGGIGKTALARELSGLLGACECRVIAMDDYLLPRLERDASGLGAHDPAASDLQRAASDLGRLKEGRVIEKPLYDHVLGRPAGAETVTPRGFLIVEGVHALHPLVRGLLDLAIFLDASPSVRFRRVLRDREEKKLTEAYALAVHDRFEEDIRKFLLPLRVSADVVLAVDDTFKLTWVSP